MKTPRGLNGRLGGQLGTSWTPGRYHITKEDTMSRHSADVDHPELRGVCELVIHMLYTGPCTPQTHWKLIDYQED